MDEAARSGRIRPAAMVLGAVLLGVAWWAASSGQSDAHSPLSPTPTSEADLENRGGSAGGHDSRRPVSAPVVVVDGVATPEGATAPGTRLAQAEEARAIRLMEEQLRAAWLALHADPKPDQDDFDNFVRECGHIESITATEAAVRLVRRGDYALIQHDNLKMLTNRGDVVPMQFSLGARHAGQAVDVLVRIDLKEFPDFAAARLSARESEEVRLGEAIRTFNSLPLDARRTALAEGHAAREAMRRPPERLADETALEFSARMRELTAKLIPSGVVIDPATVLMRRRK